VYLSFRTKHTLFSNNPKLKDQSLSKKFLIKYEHHFGSKHKIGYFSKNQNSFIRSTNNFLISEKCKLKFEH